MPDDMLSDTELDRLLAASSPYPPEADSHGLPHPQTAPAVPATARSRTRATRPRRSRWGWVAPGFAVAMTAAIVVIAFQAFAARPSPVAAPSPTASATTKVYDDIDALARDSSVIVIGSVTDQHAGISTVKVTNTPGNPGLGENLNTRSAPVAVGDLIQVREDPATSLLRPGQEYLLFLTQSTLPGDQTTQFRITGTDSGAYQMAGNQFIKIVTDNGDGLPDTIEIAGTRG